MIAILATWDEMGTGRRLVEGVLLPVAGGFGAGYAAAHSTALYVVNVAVAAAGAVYLGSQHADADAAGWRGLVSGSLFGLMIVLGLAAFGGESPAPWWIVPDARILVFLMIALPSVPLHRIGSRLRHGAVPAAQLRQAREA